MYFFGQGTVGYFVLTFWWTEHSLVGFQMDQLDL